MLGLSPDMHQFDEHLPFMIGKGTEAAFLLVLFLLRVPDPGQSKLPYLAVPASTGY